MGTARMSQSQAEGGFFSLGLETKTTGRKLESVRGSLKERGSDWVISTGQDSQEREGADYLLNRHVSGMARGNLF
jgi:hypothetical protein